MMQSRMNGYDATLFFTMMAATIQAPHGFFFYFFFSLPWSHTISKALSIQDILNTSQGLKVSPRIQGLLSRFLQSPRIQGLFPRFLQGYKAPLSRFYSQGSTLKALLSRLYSQGSTLKVSRFYSQGLSKDTRFYSHKDQ